MKQQIKFSKTIADIKSKDISSIKYSKFVKQSVYFTKIAVEETRAA